MSCSHQVQVKAATKIAQVCFNENDAFSALLSPTLNKIPRKTDEAVVIDCRV